MSFHLVNPRPGHVVNEDRLATTDARVWAEEFCNGPAARYLIGIDDASVELMTTWFANAIEQGRVSGAGAKSTEPSPGEKWAAQGETSQGPVSGGRAETINRERESVGLPPITDAEFTLPIGRPRFLHNAVAHPLLVLCPRLGHRLHERTRP